LLGETLRDPEGKIMGMILGVPRLYRLGAQRLLGLAAGNFFVDASARMQGFFMLRRFLATPGFDFLYANSCNRQSGPLWAKCGAIMVPESDVEYLFPLRLGPIAQELALRKGWPAWTGSILRSLGPMASLVAAPRISRSRFTVECCTDLELLADIAGRNRNAELLQPDRSAAYLEWVYGSLPAKPGDDRIQQIYTFTDGAGQDGWFAVRFDHRGRLEQIKTT